MPTAPPVAGLPGRNIKPQGPERQQTYPSANSAASRPSPLGISINTNVQPVNGTPSFAKTSEASGAPSRPVPKKSKPSLKLRVAARDEIGPSPCDIPICISPATLTGTPGQGYRQPNTQISRTPRIIVTPIEEEFGASSPLPQRQDIYKDLYKQTPGRVASSVYSPIGPSHQSGHLPRPRASSTSTLFEEDSEPSLSFKRRSRKSSLDSVLPTPRRSMGWWDLLTSPIPRRSSTSSSKRSRKVRNDDHDERTPLVGKAAEVDGTGERDLTRLDDPDTRRQIQESHFYRYTLPSSGEAAIYFDPSLAMNMPFLGAATGQICPSPEPASASRSIEDLSPTPSHDDCPTPSIIGRKDSQVRQLTRRVPSPTMPSRTPPRSSSAAMVERFRTSAIGVAKEDSPKSISLGSNASSTSPRARKLASPLSPSPVIRTAQVQHIHMVKSPDPTSRATPPESVSTPPSGPSRSLGAERYGTPANYNPGYADITRDDGARAPIPRQPLPPVVFDPAATPEFYKAQSSHLSTAVHSQSSSTRHLASPFETPYHSQAYQPAPRLAEEPPRSQERHYRTMSVVAEEKPKPRKRLPMNKHFCLITTIALVLIVLVVLAIVLAMTLHSRSTTMATEMHWLNLTGYPPMPTGISTIAQPNIVSMEDGCVQTSVMWSCALPKDQQPAPPNNGPAPSFRLEIAFNPDAVSNSSLLQTNVQRRNIDRRSMVAGYTKGLSKRDTFTDLMFTPIPEPPSLKEHSFLGNTTDRSAIPYAGQQTPFYISILPTTVPNLDAAELSKRAFPSNSSSSNASIPSTNLLTNGSAAPAQLYPLPTAQPLRLYDRDQPTEHYSFYTYFSKSIFLLSPNNGDTIGDPSTVDDVHNETNINGGSLPSSANTICTWSQTRFLVQIWTRKSIPLSTAPSDFGVSNYTIPADKTNATSAFNFKTPGSFPYPVTITIDRHGGRADDKGVYCHKISEDGVFIEGQRMIQQEDRGFNGNVVNPAKAAFMPMDNVGGEEHYGGIDGGTGGCACHWQNWTDD